MEDGMSDSETVSAEANRAEARAGGCHCGRVRFSARGDFSAAMACNCSICQKRGHWLAFVPAADFELQSGGDALVDYQFNTHKIHHPFCPTCGVGAFGHATGPDGSPMMAVNIRCLDDMDLTTVRVTHFDGRSR
jgi:hypothetical protein